MIAPYKHVFARQNYFSHGTHYVAILPFSLSVIVFQQNICHFCLQILHFHLLIGNKLLFVTQQGVTEKIQLNIN